jgi:hypothetical protein
MNIENTSCACGSLYYYSLLILKLLNQESFNKSYDYIMLEAISFSGENRAQVEGTGAG